MVETLDTKKVIDETKKKMTKAVDATKKEFQNIRTGRASTTLVEGIMVDYYNTPTQLKGVASISTPDAKTIAIQPWEPSLIGEIERSIMKSGLGLTPINDGRVVRMQIPPLTQERREELTKLVKKVAEEGRVSVRNARHEGIELIKKMEKGKTIPEDISHTAQKEIQKVTDSFIAQVDEAYKAKETEIHAI
jgi:ribosome recycling factor